MAGRASAYAVLGLAPGSDAAAIEEAYKRLIKQHHPDREGGDALRAAEINRAYRELRSGSDPDPLEFHDWRARRRRARWPLAVLVAGAAVGALVFATGPSVPVSANFWGRPAKVVAGSAAELRAPDPIGGPLHTDAIRSGVRDALRLFSSKNEMALTAASRDCGVRFRQDPGTAMLDRCAAFDDAVVGLQDRDPLRDAGAFAPLAVTGRQWSAASQLSDDSLAIDSRLDQIRLKVEMALAPDVPAVAPPAAAAADNSEGD